MSRPAAKSSDAERTRYVKQLFSSIPAKYDFLNHFLSAKRDIVWRKKTASMMRFSKTMSFLDIATGTADLAIEAAQAHPDITVTGIDFVPAMLAIGRRKVSALGLSKRISLVEADALALPFGDGSFDVSAVAFGIRNMPDRLKALKEMARVVVPGGQVMVLELTTPQSRLMRGVYGIYLNRLLPIIGRLFSGNALAYRYLAESIMAFPSPDEFTSQMEKAGLKRVMKFPLTFGVAHLHVGEVKGP